jgi:hypothetical protein
MLSDGVVIRGGRGEGGAGRQVVGKEAEMEVTELILAKVYRFG